MGKKHRGPGPRGHRSTTRKRMRAAKNWGLQFERMTAGKGEDAEEAARAADDAELRTMKNLPKPER